MRGADPSEEAGNCGREELQGRLGLEPLRREISAGEDFGIIQRNDMPVRSNRVISKVGELSCGEEWGGRLVVNDGFVVVEPPRD